jgi:hypothetical protein
MNMTDCYFDAANQYGEAVAAMLLDPSTKNRDEVEVKARALSAVTKSLTPEQVKSLDGNPAQANG